MLTLALIVTLHIYNEGSCHAMVGWPSYFDSLFHRVGLISLLDKKEAWHVNVMVKVFEFLLEPKRQLCHSLQV